MTTKVPIAKAGAEAFLEVDVEQIPPDTWSLVILEGLKVVLNARMSKVGAVTKKTGKDLEDAQATAMQIATQNRDNLMAGNLKPKKGASAKSDIPREVQTEARRQAREVVRNEIRKAGGKISQYLASDITAAADALIAQDASYIEKAQAAIEARANLTSAIDVSALVKADPKKVKAAEEKKAAGTLSKTQAGKVAPRKKPVGVTLAPSAIPSGVQGSTHVH